MDETAEVHTAADQSARIISAIPSNLVEALLHAAVHQRPDRLTEAVEDRDLDQP